MRSALVGSIVGLVACTKSPPAERPPEIVPIAVDAGGPIAPVTHEASPKESTSPVASAPPSKPSPSPSGSKCTKDDDCRLFSSYCAEAPCVCFALSKDEPDKTCSGRGVNCFVQPCMKRRARCESGRCQASAEK